jgi:hypothetical protein
MFGFLKSLSHKMSFLPPFCATIGKGNNRVKPTIAGYLSGGRWHRSRIAKLGPNPLRQDADKEVVWLSMQANPIYPKPSSPFSFQFHKSALLELKFFLFLLCFIYVWDIVVFHPNNISLLS